MASPTNPSLSFIFWELIDPIIFIFLSLTYIPGTVLSLLSPSSPFPSLKSLTSFSAFKSAWFAHFWRSIGPGVCESALPRAGPLIAQAKGVVLDIGPGSGEWLSCFDKEKVERIIGVEPNRGQHEMLRKRVKEAGLMGVYEIVGVGVEELVKGGWVAEREVDSVVTIQCLCSIPEPKKMIGEMYGFLKEGGTWILYEHVVVFPWQGRFLKYWQATVDIVWPHCTGGCSLTRDTRKWLKEVGSWEKVDLVQPEDEAFCHVVPHIMGVLTNCLRLFPSRRIHLVDLEAPRVTTYNPFALNTEPDAFHTTLTKISPSESQTLMEQYGMPFEATNAPPPPNFNFSQLITDAENPDEWEYEYSATETETFYVTLDLTTPEVPATQRQSNRRNAKGARWTNPGLGKYQRMARLPEEMGFKTAQVLTIDDDEDALPASVAREEEGEEDDEDEGVDGQQPAKRKYKTKEKPPPEEQPRATEVQILDLHSVKPLVSYDGHIFACRWSENIGTEFLFMPHDKDRALPVLRELKGDVDLLAASSARITAKTAHLEPKSQTKPKYAATSKAKAASKLSQPPKSNIVIHRGASTHRIDQGMFLEKLIDLKEELGEEDFVTVHARSRLTNNKWRKTMKALRATERERLAEVIESEKNGPEIVKARERLKQMDEEDEEMRKIEEEKGIGAGLNGINKRKRPVFRPKDNGVKPLMDAGQTGTPIAESSNAGTPRSYETGVENQGMYGTPAEGQDDLSEQDAEGEEDDM
ncbi:uncharacterized protein RCO7_00908 [Rhynchosporium graminicola]|uniref:Transcription factor TFIIIC triple barrel domain-containing protein n=1 Tax=Rhynchosporium graminicola TaxID=2792576 RepID=A0A1E1JQI5_9HELO|nr:uncharacterized protein RCO7_00908 [Rhynchosporium commune]